MNWRKTGAATEKLNKIRAMAALLECAPAGRIQA